MCNHESFQNSHIRMAHLYSIMNHKSMPVNRDGYERVIVLSIT